MKYNPKAPAPIYKPRRHPGPLTPVEAEKFWKQRYEEWLYGVHTKNPDYKDIPGSLVFLGEQQFIKHRVLDVGQEAIQPAIVRDVDYLIHANIREAKAAGEALLVMKGTGTGLSSNGANYAVYTAVCYPGSTSLITSHTQTAIGTLFQEKIQEPLEYYDEAIIARHGKGEKTGRIRYEYFNANKQRCFIKIKMKNFGSGSDAVSAIDCRETSERPSSVHNFAGAGANFAFVDEWAVHKRKTAIYETLISRMRDRNTREMKGFILLGGACELGDKDPEERLGAQDVIDIQKFIEPANLKANRVRMIFLPFWMGYNCEFNNGHSDREAAQEWWEKEYERVSKAKDPDAIRRFTIENPRTIDDLFEIGTGDRWEPDVMEKIKVQHDEVNLAKVQIRESGLVILNGKHHLPSGTVINTLEPPKGGVEYLCTIDGAQTSERTSATSEEERSGLAAIMTKLIDPATLPYMPVSTFLEVPKSLDASIMKLIEWIMYYNQFKGVIKINAEINAGFGENLISRLMEAGLGNVIARKKDFSKHGFPDQKQMFYYRSDDVKARQYTFANSFLRQYVSSIQMPNLLEQMLYPMAKNADLVDAWLGLFETMPMIGKNVKKKIIIAPEQYTASFTLGPNGFELVKKKADYANRGNKYQ